MHLGLVYALACLILYWLVLTRTRFGLEMRAIGGNPEAARRLGIPIIRYILIVMFAAGGVAGLAGMAEVTAIQGRLVSEISPGYGFIGFLVAWLAGTSASGIVMMSFLFALISSVGDILQITQGVPYAVVNILMAVILFIVLGRQPVGSGCAMNSALIVGVIASSIMSGTSLLYATLGEIVGERAGIVNLGLEGIMLIGAASGFAATALTGSPYLGIAAAAFAGAAANLIFAYVVVGRRANQLAAGLSLMFFGIGLSALIGRPFVGTLITGLPRLVRSRARSGRNWCAALELRRSGLSRRCRLRCLTWWLDLSHPMGAWPAHRRRKSGSGLRGRAAAATAAIPGPDVRRRARRHCRSAYVGRAHADLGRRNDGRPRLHRHRAGDLRQMESALGHCRRAFVRRR